MSFAEVLVPAGSARLQSHRAFVREWTSQIAESIAWLREVCPDLCVQGKGSANRALQVAALAADESSILKRSVSAEDFDNVEAQLANVKTKLEQLKLYWPQSAEDSVPRVSTPQVLEIQAPARLSTASTASTEIPLNTASSLHDRAEAYAVVTRACDEQIYEAREVAGKLRDEARKLRDEVAHIRTRSLRRSRSNSVDRRPARLVSGLLPTSPGASTLCQMPDNHRNVRLFGVIDRVELRACNGR